VGWWGRAAYKGQGLITEAVRAVVAIAFASFGAHRVQAISDDLNERSCKLCEQIGMDLEGILRHHRIAPDGTLRNSRVYSTVSANVSQFI